MRFLLIITPGPGVLTFAGVGAAYGWRQAFRYLFDLILGTNLVCVAVISGFATAVLAGTIIRTILLLYLLYILFIYPQALLLPSQKLHLSILQNRELYPG